MGSVDPIYIFKQQFNREEADRFVASLIQHKLVWEKLKDGDLLNELITAFKDKNKYWTAAHVCLYLSGFNINSFENLASILEKSPNTETDIPGSRASKKIYPSISQLTSNAIQILTEKQSGKNWSDILLSLSDSENISDDINSFLGTIYSIIYFLTNDRSGLISALGTSEEEYHQELLAFIIGCNPTLIQTDLLKIKTSICKIPIRKFTRSLKALSEYADELTIRDLADVYIVENPIEQKLDKNTGNHVTTDQLIEKIRIYKDYTLAANFGSNIDLSETFSRKAAQYADQLNQSLEKLSQKLKHVNGVEDKGSDHLIEEIASLSNHLGANHIAVKLLRIVEIQESDFETAKKLVKDVYNSILQSSTIREIIPNIESTDVLSAGQILELFLKLGMISETAEITEKLIDLQPRNFELIKKSANLFYDFGDHEKAVEYLTHYSLSKELTREEKLALIEAYKNQNSWGDALNIWNEINLVDFEDYQQKAICAFHAIDQKSFRETEKACKNFYNANGIFGVLRALFNLQNGQNSAAQAEIEAVLSSGKRDRFTIQYIIEFYLAVSQPEKALAWINSLSSLEKDYPEVLFMQYKLCRQLDDNKTCDLVVDSFVGQGNNVDQFIGEKYLEECIKVDDFKNATVILKNLIEKWPLSPNLIGFNAHLMLESEKYIAAQKLLNKLIQKKSTKEEWVVDYALTKIERKPKTLPLGESALDVDSSQRLNDFENKIIEQYPDNLLLKVIKAELNHKDRLTAYQDLLADNRVHHHPEIWRVHAGMGKHYFQNQKYDMALVSLKEARKQQPHLKAINLYLSNALAKMKLTDDALEILSAGIKDDQFGLQDMLEINANIQHSEQWLRMLKAMTREGTKSNIAKIILAQLYAGRNENDKARDTINTIKFSKDTEILERLICTQILIAVDLKKEAKHMLEYLLTSRKEMSSKEYLAGAFLYMQMQEYHKAANLLNLIKTSGFYEFALKADLYERLGLNKESELAIQAAIRKLEEGDYGCTNNLIPWIGKPDIWETLKSDKVWIYLKSIEISLINKDYESALEKAWKYIEKYPSDIRLSSMALNIIKLFGDDQKQDIFLEKLPPDLAGLNITDSICIYGELALNKGHEVMAANLVSQCIERWPDSRRVKALQARLLVRNGNSIEANNLIEEILADDVLEKDSAVDVLGNSQLWLAEAALELGKEIQALRICKNLFSKFGISPESARLFLTNLLKLAFENWLNKKLDVTQHNQSIGSQTFKYFDDLNVINDESIKGNQEIQELINSVKIWMQLLNGKTEIVINNDSKVMDEKALTAIRYLKNENSNLTINFTEESVEEQGKFFLSVLQMETQPEKALEYLSELIRESKNDPRHYAALAFIKKKLGRYSDAYAAINLALAEWEDEYKWQILAGELSQAIGDMHASLAHYQKAAEIHQDEETQSYLGKINYQAGNRFGISFLENKLTGGNDDLETLINLGELSIKNEKYQKAAKYLEKAIKIDPNDTRSYVLLSKVALKVGNHVKADEIIEQAFQIAPEDIEIAMQRIDIEESENGPRSALDWIKDNLEDKIRCTWQIIIKNADLLAAIEGKSSALHFLNKQREKHSNTALDLRIAKMYLEEGNLGKAEEAAEQVLSSDSNNSIAMSLLARIFSQSGDLDKALDFLIKAIQINPFAVDFYIELAKIHQSRRELDQAASVMENGLRSNPMNFDLLMSLGLLYYQQGLYKKSHNYLKQAASIDKNNEHVRRLLSTLSNANIIQPEKMSVGA